MSDDKSSKTEQASAQKLKKSREQGQVAKSQDLTSTLAMTLGMIIIAATSGFIVSNSARLMQQMFSSQTNFNTVSSSGYFKLVMLTLVNFAMLAAPILLVVMLTAFISSAAQVGLKVSMKPLEPDITKLNPINGFKKLFSLKSLVTTGLAVVKMVVIGVVGVTLFQSNKDLNHLFKVSNINTSLRVIGKISFSITLKICLILLIIAIADYVYQKWQFLQDQKMSKEDVKKEHKDQEGNPHVKGHIRNVARNISQGKGLKSAVNEADVVVTNPVHIAVAIKYDRLNPLAAPIVVAKGSRLLAERIKEFARESEIAIVQNIPLARSLFKSCEVDCEISPDLYLAVAEVLAFIYKQKGSKN
jgi:flagellar biosynthetic protein FlhB